MYTQVNKSKENSFSTNRQESRAVANYVAQKKSVGKLGDGVVDNRREAIAQKKLQLLIGGSPCQFIKIQGNTTELTDKPLTAMKNHTSDSIFSEKGDGSSGKPAQLTSITQSEDQTFDKKGTHKSRGTTNPFNLVGTLNGPNYNTIIEDESNTRFHNAHMMAATFGGSNGAENIVAWSEKMEDAWTNAENDIRGTKPDKLVSPRNNEKGEVSTTVNIPSNNAYYDEIIDDLMEATYPTLINPANWLRADPNAENLTEGMLRGYYKDDKMLDRLKIRMGVDVKAAFDKMPSAASIKYKSSNPDNKRQFRWRFNNAEEIVHPSAILTPAAVVALIKPLTIYGWRLA